MVRKRSAELNELADRLVSLIEEPGPR